MIALHTGGTVEAWNLHPDLWLLLALLQGGYLFAVMRLGPSRVPAGASAVRPRQLLCFTGGVLAFLVVLDGPVHNLAEGYLFSVHMVQHLVLLLVAPPLLLLGLPAWLARMLLNPRPLMRLARVAANPLCGVVAFNVVIVVIHLPGVVQLQAESAIGHYAVHMVMVGAALVMWLPVFSPLPELPRLSYPAQMLYLFVQSIIPTVPASFLTFSETPLYEVYEQFPRIGLSVVEDQRISGLIMKLGGGLYLWGIIATLFFRWYAREEALNPSTPVGTEVKWEDIERELEEMGLTRR